MQRSNDLNIKTQRRGATVALVAVSLVVILGFTALTIDLGRLYLVRTELQAAADSAALAGASAFANDVALANDSGAQLLTLLRARAQQFSSLNKTLGAVTLLESADIVIGTHDFDNPGAPLDTSGTEAFNAAEITVRRTEGSSNGPVGFFFASILGRDDGGVIASARAALNDRVAVYGEESIIGRLMPYSIYSGLYDYALENGTDGYSYDGSSVSNTGDGVPEARIFPWKWKDKELESLGVDTGGAPGNYGALEIGSSDGSSSVLIEQITNGVSLSDVSIEFGGTDIDFQDSDGNPTSFGVSGQPGNHNSIEDALLARVGDVVAFFVHESVSGNGSNAVYKITGIRFGRIMHVDLGGNAEDNGVYIQPVVYTDQSIWVTNSAQSTSGTVGRVRLVQ
ncbi:MAG: hypothetical protein IH986_09085 [Planctomycetes bacterium]|nr:hypothetical protein [Planctomycetota bacterium]